MDKIAGSSDKDRSELFEQTANNRGLTIQIIEKDFWVCWTLKHLFQLPKISKFLIFKGGTSLSKIYKIIERFSEDIDVAIDRDYLGFDSEVDLRDQSAKERNEFVDALDAAAKQVVQGHIYRSLAESFTDVIGDQQSNQWQLTIDELTLTDRLYYLPTLEN